MGIRGRWRRALRGVRRSFADWPRLRAFVEEAEALGADSYWIPDHPTFNPDWATTLASLAVTTDRIRKAERLPTWVRDQFAVGGLLATPDVAIGFCRALVDAGLRYFILRIWEDDIDSVRLFASEVLPALREVRT